MNVVGIGDWAAYDGNLSPAGAAGQFSNGAAGFMVADSDRTQQGTGKDIGLAKAPWHERQDHASLRCLLAGPVRRKNSGCAAAH